MNRSDIEELARKAGFLVVVLEPGAGHDPIRLIQPISSTNVAVELSKFVVLVLEKAAEVAKSEPRVWDTTAPDPQTRIHDKLRRMAAALQSGDRG